MVDVKKIAAVLTESYNEEETGDKCFTLPERDEIVKILDDLQKLAFPACFAPKEAGKDLAHFAEETISSVYFRLKKQLALAFSCDSNCGVNTEKIAGEVLDALPEVRRVLLTDLQATFEGDPAAKSKAEIAFCYPGIYAIFVYRIAHLFYERNVPFIPRMMSEHAHGRTGIDINPGAKIGEYFFIDHGTGIVIGETTVIGNRVKIYQNVTLGALSPRKGQSLAGVKRHPTVEDDVTVYSGASILGGETVIGKGAIIGGNCFLTESVAAGAKVSAKLPELIIK